MTNEDAINILLYMKHDVIANSSEDVALDTAIEALKSKEPKTNGDCIRNMLTDEYIVKNCFCVFFDECCDCPLCAIANCQDIQTRLEWLKQAVIEDAGSKTD